MMLRRYAVSRRVSDCGRRLTQKTGPTVTVRTTAAGRTAKLHGVMTCGHIWDCPVCSAKLRTERAMKIKRVVDADPEAWRLVTLTVRHHSGHALDVLMKGLARAWARMRKGRAGQMRFAAVVAYVRVWDMTHGSRGWHPHCHALVRFADDVDVVAWEREWAPAWRDAVRAELGPECVPDETHGTHVSHPGKKGERGAAYVAKLGIEVAASDRRSARGAFELSAVETKRAYGASRNPWQLAKDVALKGNGHDVWEWVQYQEGVRGRRCIEWSRDARELLNEIVRKHQHEVNVEDCAREMNARHGALDGAFGRAAEAVIHLWPEEWQCIIAYERLRPPGMHDLLEVAKRAGVDGVRDFVAMATNSVRRQQFSE